MKIPLTGWPVFGLFLAVFLTAYAPVVVTSYAFFDDYSNLAKGPHEGKIATKISEGRPLLALGKQLSLHIVTDIEDLRYLRLVWIVGLAVLAWSVFHIFVRVGWSRVQSFYIAVIMCSTLPFQVYIAWAFAGFNIVAALASGLAFFLGEQAFETRQSRPRWLLAAGASLALLGALTIHQSAAMFFWVFVAVVVLKPTTSLNEAFRRFGWYGLIAAVGMLWGLGVYELGLTLNPGVPARTGLVQDVPLKTVWFLFEALPNALHFALLSPSSLFSDGSPTLSSFYRGVDILLAWSLLVIIGGGLTLYFQGTRTERLGKVGIAVSILLLSYAPSLVVEEYWATYRTLPSLTSIVVVYMVFTCHGYTQHLRWLFSPVWASAFMGSIALVSGLLARYQVQFSFVTPQVQELEIMRAQLVKEDISQVRGIYVIRPARQETLASRARYDEFGQPSSSARPWTARDMVIVLLRDMAPGHAALPITAVFADDPREPPPDSLVVDMRRLRLQAQHGNGEL